MRKIGIITINDYKNYGNRLQNYAVQEVIKELGFTVETIVNTTSHLREKEKVSNIKKAVYALKNNPIWDVVYKIYKKKYREKYNTQIVKAYELKKERLICFTDRYIKESKFTISDTNIPKNELSTYDYFVVGSDQVWNPNFERFSHIDFLTFAPRFKRIAYAASFGIEELPAELNDNFKEWLLGMNYISTREEAGQKLIQELTNIDSTVLVDPTLMLSKEQWKSISKVSEHKPTNKYILTYFLGDTTIERIRFIKQCSKEYNCEIINLSSIFDLALYSIDPSEFIDFFNSACIICTDSYHGIIFSILFEKPFIVFERLDGSMSSRVDTLLNKFNFDGRRFEHIKKNNDILNISFLQVPNIISSERRKALEYLKKALNVK